MGFREEREKKRFQSKERELVRREVILREEIALLVCSSTHSKSSLVFRVYSSTHFILIYGGIHMPRYLGKIKAIKRMAVESSLVAVRLPSQFNQLTNLQALELTFVGITSTHLEMLVAGCPRLENLTIWQCVHLSELRIRAPNLLLLDIFVEEDERRFRFSLIKAPRLKHVVLGYSLNKEFWHDFSEEEDEEDENEIDEVDNLIKLLMNLDHLESFSFRCCLHLFKFKSIMRLPDSLPIGCQLVHLKKLFMELNFDDAAMVSPLLFLLRSCPNLEQLSLKCRCSKIGFPIETNYWEKQKPPECLKSHLMTIQIEDICLSSKNVIEFVKFLLVNAHVLVRMGLLYSKSSRDQSEEDIVVNELLLFNRASQNALLEIKPGRSLYGG
ncbi:hypothetical protein AAC387_Pa12g1169 [Persea americana]